MKSKLTKVILLVLTLILVFGTVQTFAYQPYDTYTYSIDGLPLMSPTAYTPSVPIDSFGMGLMTEEFGNTALYNAADIFTDNLGNVYISDKGNNRVVVLNKYYKAIAVIDDYVDEYGNAKTLSAPEGIYITDPTKTASKESYIYVCDTGNAQIVVFDRDYNYVRTITAPESPLLNPEQFVPNSVAVDIYGRIFVVSKRINKGVVVLSSNGDFTGYIGAQAVTYSIIDIIWRNFQTKEQRMASVKNVSVSYNNLTVDDDGFVYATSDQISEKQQLAAIKSKNPDYSPVKKLNSTGVEIMKRNGFFDPGGEVNVYFPEEVSKINDVALGAEGSWTILDYKRSRFFTYDQNGNLLFAFGDKGDQLGNGQNYIGMAYQVVDGKYNLIALDSTTVGMEITVYTPTKYCDTIVNALKNQNQHNYSASIDYWQEVLTLNNNFDLAYIGIGKALYSQGKYSEARDILSKAYETEYSSKAFAEQRQNIIGRAIIWIVLGAVVVVVLLSKFLGYAKRKNKAAILKVGRKSYWEELLYPFHLVFHPFDGFWDLKHEKRGSVRAGSTILGITIVALFYNSIGKGYLFDPRGTNSTIFVAILSVALPVLLWTVSNWCLTTLFDGEGSLKDIYVATTYSLAPLPIFLVISTLLTYVLTSNEGKIPSLLITFGLIWTILLLFFGTMVTHDYPMNKNIITVIGTIVAMAVIMFVAILFSSLMIKMVTFIAALVSEIFGRV